MFLSRGILKLEIIKGMLPACAARSRRAACSRAARHAARRARRAAARGTGRRTRASSRTPRSLAPPRLVLLATCRQPSWIADASFYSPPAVLVRAKSLQY